MKVTIGYKLYSKDPLELRYKYGFELGCGNGTSTAEASQWIEGTATAANRESVQVEFVDCPSPLSPVSIRYCWRTDPCTFKMCPIYAGDLPSPPFMMDLQK
jgi:sialate O-acetylesterase